ncbi:replication initiation and membrane attachment family protein [Staphylococcus pseudoxylosus]|uniref:replication initiation and membrane attachment family protein n=1 Tax=Staphylococcus pseudoxylosus TaxID=2282419 RepID=UPI000D1E7AF1|nr:DnaD domain protein [Staphylococcus pseudoxylosus]PTI82592.1 helicase DnaB [Staphylococcus xylosus]MBM2658393.1 DnaD domain protein [Staphylococcus pseudoxylosus]MDW8546991.1 DnaD domain protein [Staphylococcus pseudoxylosus]MEB5783496.1 DnaD domain protein [Staphylococcus pseudoxylosus]MEB6169206.1 DnaD domain protein [Staphylococcus pseudoxylosus]
MGLQSYDYGLRPHDNFTIVREFYLNNNHLEILNRLFTPMIGANATGLYHYLNQFVDHEVDAVLTHYIIMSELKINLLEFRKEMDLLEGIGLVKSYVNHNEQHSSFVYVLNQPPTAKQFFSDPMLSVYLYSEVSKQRYQQLKRHFETKNAIDLNSYQDITRTFTDVFKIPNKALTQDTTYIQDDKPYEGLDLTRVHFDFETLYDLLQNHFISSKIVTNDAKALITQIATLYGLTPESMKRIILKSITSAQELSFEELRKHARTYYLMEHEQQLPNLQVKSEKDNVPSQVNTSEETSSQSDNWLVQLEQTSPIDMLASWSESEPTTQQKFMIEELIERENLSFGVINILLQFVMLKEDMKLPKTYIFEIASNWKKKGIKTAEQAYEYAMKVNQPKKDSYPTKNRYKQKQLASREMTPKWLEERDEKPEKDNEQHNVEEDEKLKNDREQFLNQLKNRWKEGE